MLNCLLFVFLIVKISSVSDEISASKVEVLNPTISQNPYFGKQSLLHPSSSNFPKQRHTTKNIQENKVFATVFGLDQAREQVEQLKALENEMNPNTLLDFVKSNDLLQTLLKGTICSQSQNVFLSDEKALLKSDEIQLLAKSKEEFCTRITDKRKNLPPESESIFQNNGENDSTIEKIAEKVFEWMHNEMKNRRKMPEFEKSQKMAKFLANAQPHEILSEMYRKTKEIVQNNRVPSAKAFAKMEMAAFYADYKLFKRILPEEIKNKFFSNEKENDQELLLRSKRAHRRQPGMGGYPPQGPQQNIRNFGHGEEEEEDDYYEDEGPGQGNFGGFGDINGMMQGGLNGLMQGDLAEKFKMIMMYIGIFHSFPFLLRLLSNFAPLLKQPIIWVAIIVIYLYKTQGGNFGRWG